MATKRRLVVIDGDRGGPPTPVGFKVRERVPRPTTAKKALGEAASTYAAVRRGEIAPEDGTKLLYMLRTCGDLAVIADLEPRLDELAAKFERLERVLPK